LSSSARLLEETAMETLLPLLALLACPVGMGLMMLFMGSGMSSKNEEPRGPDAPSLAQIKAEQARLHEQIEHLEGRERHVAGRV